MSNSIARWALLGVACLGVLAGCGSEQGPPSPAPTDDPSTSAPAALTAFSLVRTGGEAGVSEELRVEPDGTAVLVAEYDASAGMLSANTMSALTELLTSAELWAEDDTPAPDDVVCNDGFTLSLRMGDLTVGRVDCGDSRDMPSYDEVLELLGPALSGEFDGGLPDSVPALAEVTLVRSSDGAAYPSDGAVAVSAYGSAVVTTASGVDIPVDLSTGQRDALRLLVPRLSPDSAAPGDCTMPGSYELTIAGQQPIALTGCSSMPNRDFDLAGVVVVMENLMDSVID